MITINVPDVVRIIARLIDKRGGKAYLVGGAVRGSLMGEEITSDSDLDIEIHLLSRDVIINILEPLFDSFNMVGQSFGVIKATIGEYRLDISFPRKDSKVRPGHDGFDVEINPFMGAQEAARRRDFRMNSIMYDIVRDRIVDPFCGENDIRHGILRVTDENTFADDPLRVYRACQFIARFNLIVSSDSLDIMRETVARKEPLANDRIIEEFDKMMMAPNPEYGLILMDQLGILPDCIAALKDVPQPREYHPEGDAFEHTLMTVAEAAMITKYWGDCEKKRVVMYAALLHDVGKAVSTRVENGKIIAHGHDDTGASIADVFLREMGFDNYLTERVVPLIREHMFGHNTYGTNVSKGAFRRLARRLYPATISQLAFLTQADSAGALRYRESENERDFLLENARNAYVENSPPEDIIMGRDLMRLGYTPGPIFGQIIKAANDAHEERDVPVVDIKLLMATSKDAYMLLKELQEVGT